jgi:hypothetical protein
MSSDILSAFSYDFVSNLAIEKVHSKMDLSSVSPLPIDIWTARAREHEELLADYTEGFIRRRSQGLTHAVLDFLFVYYNCSPTKLKQWVPSISQELVIDTSILENYPWLKENWFCKKTQSTLALDLQRFPQHTYRQVAFIAQLCSNILERSPRFSCFGLHEWAMVYKSTPEDIRHKGFRLRLSPQELADFVENQMICCSHYDAYRFFTADARPLNVLQPQYDTRLHMEQGGCLHANMDLYKWATKLWPWIGSDFIAKTFLLALACRELDMRASPYDLTEIGYTPFCIETEEGKKQYQQAQQLLATRAIPLREELKKFCHRLEECAVKNF